MKAALGLRRIPCRVTIEFARPSFSWCRLAAFPMVQSLSKFFHS